MRSKFPKAVIILGFVSLFTDIASEMLYPVMPVFMTSALGASMVLVGLLEGIAEFTAGLLKGYAGVFSDKIQKRSIFVIFGYSLSALSKPMPGLFATLPVVIGSRITDRIGKGIRTAPRDALLGSYAKENSGAIFGFHRAMDTLGAAIGPMAALILLFFYPKNYTLIFLIAFIPSLAAILFTLLVKDNPDAITKVKPKINYKGFWAGASKKYKHLIVYYTLFSFANSSDVFLILKANKISASVNAAIIGYIIYNLVYAVSSYPLGSLSDKYSKKTIFSIGLFIFSLVYLGFGVVNNITFIYLLFVLYGIYAASTEGIMKAWISDIVPNQNKGTGIGLLTMLSSFAAMLGSVFAGIVWENISPNSAFGFSAFFAFIILILLLIDTKIKALEK